MWQLDAYYIHASRMFWTETQRLTRLSHARLYTILLYPLLGECKGILRDTKNGKRRFQLPPFSSLGIELLRHLARAASVLLQDPQAFQS